MNKKEQDIQRLLEAMNEKLENEGYPCDFPFFDFDIDTTGIAQELGFEQEYFYSLLKSCISRKLIKKMTLGSNFSDMALTYLGQQQALYGNVQQGESAMAIGQITINGPAQIGNGNIQNFSNFISTVESKINEAPVSESDKEEAKTLIQKVSENQLASQSIASAIGAMIGGVVNSFCK